MTDVLKIALERRSKLQEEVDRLDDFIRMAETLIRAGGAVPASTAAPAPAPAAAPAATPIPAAPAAPKAVNAETEESPMRAAARRLSDAEPRRAPDTEAADGADVPRPSIIRRGLAG